MDPFTARMLERARDRQRRVDERTGAAPAPAPAPARSPLRTGVVTNSESTVIRQTEKSASPRRVAVEHREDKENRPNVLHESTRSRLKQLGSLYSADGDTDLDSGDVELTPRHSRTELEPEPSSRPLAASSSSSAGLRSRLAGLASQYQEIESEELQGFTPTGSRSRLVYDFSSEPGRSPSPPRVVSAVPKSPSPEKTGGAAAAAPYRSASPVRYSPPPRPQPASPTGVPYIAPAQGCPTRQLSPARQGSPTRQPSPVRGRLVQERAAVFDRPASPPPPDVDPTEMTLSDRRKLFEKGQPPKVIARFGTPVTPHMLRQQAGSDQGPPPPAGRSRGVTEPSRPWSGVEETRSRSPLRQTAPAAAPSGPPSPTRAVGESTFQAHRKLWESMNNDWRQNEIAQSARQQREKELGLLANRWQHRQAEAEPTAADDQQMEMTLAPPPPAAAAAGGIPPPPPPPPPAVSPSRQAPPAGSPSRHSPVHYSPSRRVSPARHSPARHSPSRHAEGTAEAQHGSGESGSGGGSSPHSAVYRGSTAADESTVSYTSGHSDAESLGAEILAMARANQPPPSLPTIDESTADSSSDLSGMAACAAIDDVLDDMDNDQEPTPPKRTRRTILRRCTSQPASFSTSNSAADTSTAASASTAHITASTASTGPSTASAASDTASTTTVSTVASDAARSAKSPSVAELIRHFQRPPAVPHPQLRRSAPCLRSRPAPFHTSTPRRSASGVSVALADVTAVLPMVDDGLEPGLEAESIATLTNADLSTDTAPKRSDLTFEFADQTLTRRELPSGLADSTPARLDLTFDLTSPAPVAADLGAVSLTTCSPRCWEEVPTDQGCDASKGMPAADRSRLRQYLFGAPNRETDTQPRRGYTGTDSVGSVGLELEAGVSDGLCGSEMRERESESHDSELGGDESSSPHVSELEGEVAETSGKLSPDVAPPPGADRGGGEGAGKRDVTFSGDVTVSDIVTQLEAVCLRRGGGDGEAVQCSPGQPDPHRDLPPAAARHKDSGVFRTPMASVQSPEQEAGLRSSVVLDGDGAEMPLLHSVSFYRRQKPQEVQVTPVRPVIRNREVPTRYDETDSSSSQQQPVGASTQERIKHLQKEATQQMTVMSQASRALNLCNATIEFTGSAEMVEAERLLLVATHRRQAALSEIQRLKTEGAMRQQGIHRPASRGSLSVSSVTLPVKTSFVREVAAGSANYVYYFVVLLRYRGQVIATQMLSSEDSIKGNAINFPNLVSFRELEAEFCVALEVYGLQTQREVLPHEAKYHIRKDRTKTPKKLLKQQSSLTSPALQSPAGPGAVRATCFQLMGFIHLTARNLTNNSWALERVPPQSPLDGGVLMTVTCHADCAVEERGFITVFDDVSGFGAWHRRWAALAGGRLSFWRYPEDEGRAPPSAELDLRRCVTERVGPVPRDICARQNTLLLVTVREARPEDGDSLVMQRRGTMTRLRHLLSLDGRDERQLWADKLNETLANIRAWDPDAMQPHLDPSA